MCIYNTIYHVGICIRYVYIAFRHTYRTLIHIKYTYTSRLLGDGVCVSNRMTLYHFIRAASSSSEADHQVLLAWV